MVRRVASVKQILAVPGDLEPWLPSCQHRPGGFPGGGAAEPGGLVGHNLLLYERQSWLLRGHISFTE